MTGPTSTVRREARQRATRLAALALGLLVFAAAAYHAAAVTAYRDSARPKATAQRLESARLAAALEPWEERLVWRVAALKGLLLFERGEVDDAYRLLEPYSRIVRGDDVYRAAFQSVVRAKASLDARKARQQHAPEPAVGVLREKDAIR